jgi:hypothetical protein
MQGQQPKRPSSSAGLQDPPSKKISQEPVVSPDAVVPPPPPHHDEDSPSPRGSPPPPPKSRRKKKPTLEKPTGAPKVTKPLSQIDDDMWDMADAHQKKEDAQKKEEELANSKVAQMRLKDALIDGEDDNLDIVPPSPPSPTAPTDPPSPRFVDLENSPRSTSDVVTNCPRIKDMIIPTQRDKLNEMGILAMSGRMKNVTRLKEIDFGAIHDALMLYQREESTVALMGVRNLMFTSRESCEDLFGWYNAVLCYLLWLTNGKSHIYETPSQNDPKYERIQMIWELMLKFGKFGKNSTANIVKSEKKIKKRIKNGELVARMNESVKGIEWFFTGGVGEMDDVLWWLKQNDLVVCPAGEHPRILPRGAMQAVQSWIENGSQGELSQDIKKQLGWKDK